MFILPKYFHQRLTPYMHPTCTRLFLPGINQRNPTNHPVNGKLQIGIYIHHRKIRLSHTQNQSLHRTSNDWLDTKKSYECLKFLLQTIIFGVHVLPPRKLTYPTLGKEKKSSSKYAYYQGDILVFMEGSRLWGHCARSRDPSNFHRNRIFSILRRSGFFSPAGNLVVSVLWGGRGPVCCVFTTGIQTEA